MRKNYLVLYFLSLGLIGFFPPPSKAAVLHVLLDPGHGGIETGAVRGEAKEAEITLKVALFLRDFLDKDQNNFKASLTRDKDKSLSLQERVTLLETLKADLFISIHANASEDPQAQGVEFFLQNLLPANEEAQYLASVENKFEQQFKTQEQENSKKGDLWSLLEDLKRQHRMRESLELSKSLSTAWSPSTKNKARVKTVRQAPFYVISKGTVPSVLIELGFLTHQKERDLLLKPFYQKQLAKKIYMGLKAYKEMIDKTEVRQLKSSP